MASSRRVGAAMTRKGAALRGLRCFVLLACVLSAIAAAPTRAESDAAPSASAEPDVEPVTGYRAGTVEALAGYLAGVRLHLEADPALAAAYVAFFAELDALRHTAGDLVDVPAEAFAALEASTRRVERAVVRAMPARGGDYVFGDVLERAVAAAPTPTGDAERLLATLDRVVAPRVRVDGRYEYARGLEGRADLGFAAELWSQCRRLLACIEAHDAVFAPAMAGASLATPFAERVARDAALAATAEFRDLFAEAAAFEARLEGLATPEAVRGRLAAVADDYWRSIAERIVPGSPADVSFVASDGRLDALVTLGRAGASLAGQESLARSFGILRAPLLDFGRSVVAGATGLAATVGGVGLLFAGAQALAAFDPGAGSSPPPELTAFVARIGEDVQREVARARIEQAVATSAVDARVAGLAVAVDVIRDDVGRVETAQRRKVASDFAAADARRWTEFDADNDRCFSLRSRDAATGRLRPAEFRRCEERFLQGAARRASYATRATDYLLDARFIEAGDARFPFHHHYPLLMVLAGFDTRRALDVGDPLEWQQHAAALLRLYQENPAGAGETRQRGEVLRALRQAGERSQQALATVAFDPAQPAQLRLDTHQRALDEYAASLSALVRRVRAVDDPDADRFGKRLTEDLAQPAPTGSRRTVIEAALARAGDGTAGVRSCADAPAEHFLPSASGLSAEARRFFDSPITADELAGAWNRVAVDDMALEPASRVDLVPAEFLWPALDGLGRIEVCFEQFRPEAASFTREAGPVDDTLLGTTTIHAVLAVRFVAAPATAASLGVAARPITIATFEATRACAFGYRNDEKGCSRAQCLAELAPAMWAQADLRGGRCENAPLVTHLVPRQTPSHSGEVIDFAAALGRLYWEGRAARLTRLEADVLRSTEYAQAAAQYLRYYALAAVSLGLQLDADEDFRDDFAADGVLTPRAVVRALLDDKRPPATIEAQLAAGRERALSRVGARIREPDAAASVARLPHFAALAATLARLDLALAAYSAGG